MGWIEDRWHGLTGTESGAWLAVAVWAALIFGVIALVYVNQQLRRSRRLTVEQTRPHVSMFMEPHAADWHVIELVVRNFGQTPAYDVQFSFAKPPTVARYEAPADGYADVVPLKLPDELPVLAPGQEWRTVWDSAIDRAELGDAIESRFTGAVTYCGRPEQPARAWWRWRRERPRFESRVTLDWTELPPVGRLELLTTHDLAKREKQKLELLRSLLTYFHYASKENHPDVFRSETDRINRATREVQERLQNHAQPAESTDITVRLGDAAAELRKQG